MDWSSRQSHLSAEPDCGYRTVYEYRIMLMDADCDPPRHIPTDARGAFGLRSLILLDRDAKLGRLGLFQTVNQWHTEPARCVESIMFIMFLLNYRRNTQRGKSRASSSSYQSPSFRSVA